MRWRICSRQLTWPLDCQATLLIGMISLGACELTVRITYVVWVAGFSYVLVSINGRSKHWHAANSSVRYFVVVLPHPLGGEPLSMI